MLEKLYNSQKKIITIIIILIIMFLIIPNLLYIPYELNDIVHSNTAIGKAGEKIEFKWTIEQIGGFERFYEIRDIEIFEGDWDFSIDGTKFSIPADSEISIYIRINIPENAENGDRYHIQFGYVDLEDVRQHPEEHSYSTQSFTVYVDNRDPPETEINSGYSYNNGSGISFHISPIIIIPLIIIIFCISLLIMSLTYTKHRSPPAPNR